MGSISFGVILAILASVIMAINAFVITTLVRLIWKTGYLGLCFVLNLAVADALVGFSITGLVTEELYGPEHKTPQKYCLLRMACITCPSAASIFTVILISFDRYLAIEHPFQYLKIMCAPLVGACVGGLWLLASLIGFLPVIVRRFQQKDYQGQCTFFAVFQPTYMLTVFCVGFFPACFVFIYFHCHLLKVASLHAQQIREQEPPGSAATCLPPPISSATKAVRTVAILVGCFVISWSPFFIGSLIQIVCQDCPLHYVLERYLWVLGMCNSLVNPLVYAFWQKEVRLQIHQMCLCMKMKVFPLFCVDNHPHAPSKTVVLVHAISLAQPVE
uniref:Glucose-dependent insulinotropic receptor n=1 Tax=Pogona vitticeps TaxID=103695 RepID=A0A6J0UQB7_9SAUR